MICNFSFRVSNGDLIYILPCSPLKSCLVLYHNYVFFQGIILYRIVDRDIVLFYELNGFYYRQRKKTLSYDALKNGEVFLTSIKFNVFADLYSLFDLLESKTILLIEIKHTTL